MARTSAGLTELTASVSISGMSTEMMGRECQSGEDDVKTIAAEDVVWVWLAGDDKLKTRCSGLHDSE